MNLLEMTWDEVKDYLRTTNLLVIPIGSIEQHGTMAPIGTDSFVATEIAERIGNRLSIIVAPTIITGYVEPKFLRFPGSLCIKGQTFSNILEDVITSFSKQGFKNFLIINAHEQNKPFISEVAQRVAQQNNIKTISFEFWYLIQEEMKEFIKSELVHACEDEISIVLAIKPELVKMKKVVDEMPVEAELNYSIYPIPEKYQTKSGVMGKPSLATKEKGKKILDLTVKKAIEIIREEFVEKYDQKRKITTI